MVVSKKIPGRRAKRERRQKCDAGALLAFAGANISLEFWRECAPRPKTDKGLDCVLNRALMQGETFRLFCLYIMR